MTNLRELRLRMRAIRQTLQVTKAMNLISTSKLRNGRRILSDTEPYFNRIQESMLDIIVSAERIDNKFLNASGKEDTSRTAIVVITSDKGLAGGYNANVFRHVDELCQRLSKPVLILIGEIGHRHFIHSPWLVLENFSFKSRMPSMEDAKEIADYLILQYIWGSFEEIHLVYTHMYNTIKLLPRELQLLPLNEEWIKEEAEINGIKKKDYHFEYLPSRNAVLDTLVPMYVRGVLHGALVEAYVSEHSARMSAMDESTKSAEELLGALQIHYNRTRQAKITQEMTEITGGAEALS